MNRQIRFTAMLLAVCLFLNSVAIPVAAESVLEPAQETTEETTLPVEAIPSSIEKSAVPTEEITDSTEEITDSTEEITDSTEEITDSSDEITAPVGEASAPAEEATDLTEGTTNPTEETTYSMPQYQPEGNTLDITSARDLVMLSYANPQEYCNLNLTFSPSDEENAGFDLLSTLDGLQFQGLGSEEYPFRGEILFVDGTGSIALNRPLFNALSDDAKITGLSLESHVQGIAEGGLLANTVTHGQGGSSWTITLTRPQPEENTEFNLIPLMFNLENSTDVSLSLADLSGLSVLGSGYLCAVMGENAQVSLSDIDTIPAVIGSGDDVGGLVGLMKSGASLTVMGDSIRVSDVNGNWNAGGIVGSAIDPMISLPPVIGCDGSVVGGVNVGGVIGRLTYTPGDHTLSISLSNLTLEGSDNAGGLIGILLRDEGTLTLDAQVDRNVLAEGAIYCGSLFGTYYTSNPEGPLVLNGEALAGEAELEALAGLVDYPGKPEIIFTVEDTQEIIDSILSAELRPGEMSPLWWAVVSGKLNAEELAAQLNAYYSGAEETEPSEKTEPTEAGTTDFTEATEIQEADKLPQEIAPGEAASIPAVASFSLQADASAVSFAEESTEPTSTFQESLISSYASESTPDWPINTSFDITKVEDLVLLSQVERSKYYNASVTVKVIEGSVFDLTKSYDVTSGSTMFSSLLFQGLGDDANPFSGSFTLDQSCSNLVIKLNRPLFNALSDTAQLSTLNLRSSITTNPTPIPAALLADKVHHTSQAEGEATAQSSSDGWNITLQGIKGYSLPLIGTMMENSSVSVTMSSLTVGTVPKDETGNDVDSSFSGEEGSASDLTVLGGGFLCSTMGSGASLTVSVMTEIPVVNNNSGDAGSLVGTMSSNAVLIVNGTDRLTINTVAGTTNAGGLVGSMASRASLNVSLSGENAVLKLSDIEATDSNAGGLVGSMKEATVKSLPGFSALKNSTTRITVKGKNAGGLVGYMEGNCSLPKITEYSVPNVTGKEYAGGLVGYAEDPVTTWFPEIDDNIITDYASIDGDQGSGGLIGYLEISGTTTFKLNTAVKRLNMNKGACGGLFGKLKTNSNDGITFTLSAPAVTEEDNRRKSNIDVYLSGNTKGGLIGSYTTNNLKNTLYISDVYVKSTSSNGNAFGGVIGLLNGTTPSYVKFYNVTTQSSGTPGDMGGLIAGANDKWHVIDVGSVTINHSNDSTNQICGTSAVGGLVGYMQNGILRIRNVPTFAEGTTHAGTNKAKSGWILGERGDTKTVGNALVYYEGDGAWNCDKGSETNDIGTWGQVLQVGTGSRLYNQEDRLLTFDDKEHTVTVRALTFNNDAVQVTSEVDFAAAALRVQLQENTPDTAPLKFEDKIPNLQNINLNLACDSLDLRGTGLTNLTRDKAYNDASNYKFTITGSPPTPNTTTTIILSGCPIYATNDSRNDKASSHNRQGLIAEAAEVNISNLTIAGSSTVTPRTGGIIGGALVADTHGNVNFTNVKSSYNWIVNSSNENCIFSGMVATARQKCASLSFTSCSWNGYIKGTSLTNSIEAGFLATATADPTNNSNREMNFTNCKVAGSITHGGTNKSGGLIASLLTDRNKIAIEGLDVSPTINTNGGNGGLLGYEWTRATVTLSGVKVHGSTLTSGSFGGLVYRGSGYWKVEQDSQKIGISFQKADQEEANSFTGTPDENVISGLLVCQGFNVPDDDGANRGALYLEILKDAYTIGKDSVSLLGIAETDYFDEIVGSTKGGNGNGIVSIGTAAETEGDPRIDQNECNTYKPQLSAHYQNPHTRYYYDLDSFRKSGCADGAVNTPGEMVLLSAAKHGDSSLCETLLGGSPGSFVISGNIDLTDRSFYPIRWDGTVSISGAAIQFDYEKLESVEATGIQTPVVSAPESGAETENTESQFVLSENRKPSSVERQHYQMHTGIFESVPFGSLNVTNLTLTGNVGGSAIIRDTAYGADQNNITTLTISDVNLAGIRISGSDKPLLINKIGNYTTLSMSDVETITGTDANGNPVYYYDSSAPVATSLIGEVGGPAGKGIRLTFSRMGLDGRTGEGSSYKFGTKKTIFSQALFLLSFQNNDESSCSGTYNFAMSESIYTEGLELSNTDPSSFPENFNGVSGRNNGNQYYFFQSEVDFVYPGDESKTVDGAARYYVENNYLRYVSKKESGSFHELDINQLSPDLNEGCGTYADPYIIRNAKQLYTLSTALSGSKIPGWKINVNAGALEGTFADADGNHTNHSVYTCGSNSWTDPNGQTYAGTKAIEDYLRSAYYRLAGPKDGSGIDTERITLSASKWTGLGSAPEKAFSGVIVGPATVTIEDFKDTHHTQFGGLIRFSKGSVVKNVTINYADTPRITNVVPSDSTASFFGGVVGWCVGGDTIIDDVMVNYPNNTFTVTDADYLTAVGGYVGMVGGYSNELGGGVVFRTRVSTISKANGDTSFYHNPYVGRVLDGYAMSTNCELNNSDNNYQIPQITLTDLGLNFDSSTAIVSNADGLWALSAIVNSGAGGNDYGQPRTGSYADVGGDYPENDTAELDDQSPNGNRCYLSNYSTGDIPSAVTAISITGGCDMSTIGTGFRGIGGSYSGRIPALSSVTASNDAAITLSQHRNEYTDEASTWTTSGTGLFPTLKAADDGLRVSGLSFSGSTQIFYYDSSNVPVQPNVDNILDGCAGSVGAGMLAGSLDPVGGGSITLESINLQGCMVNTPTAFAGGLIGLCCKEYRSNPATKFSAITVADCFYSNLNVTSYAIAGGFLGYVYADTLSVSVTTEKTLSGTVTTTHTDFTKFLTGVGGLIGRSDCTTLTLGGSDENNMTLSNLTVKNQYNGEGGDKTGTGGLGGLLCLTDNGTATIENIVMEKASIQNERIYNFSGGIAGFIGFNNQQFDGKFNWGSNNVTVNTSNVQISDSTVKKTYQAGIVYGVLLAGKEAPFRNITINTVTLSADGSGDPLSLGGLVGTVSNSNNLSVTDLIVTNTNIWKQHGSRGAGLLFGFSNSGTINIKNILLKGCNIASNHENAKCGLLFGDVSSSVNGFNILIDGCTIGLSLSAENTLSAFTSENGSRDSIGLKDGSYKTYANLAMNASSNYSSSSNLGVLCGKANNVKLVGVSVQNSNTPAKNFGSTSGTSYVIRADYTGEAAKSESPKSSQVTVLPAHHNLSEGLKSLTGDGLGMEVTTVTDESSGVQTTTKAPFARKILNDYSSRAKNQVYFNLNEEDRNYFNVTARDSISTFHEAGKLDDSTKSSIVDFPVLVINSDEGSNADTIIKRYVAVLTNQASGALNINSISFSCYYWENNSFVKDTEDTRISLKKENNKITVYPGRFDDQQKKFTLVDVTFNDPTTDEGSVYHLYIPVIVRKIMAFKFRASTENGSSYNAGDYADLSQTTLASNKELVTSLLTFQYQWSASEWKTAVDSGTYLLWNFDKEIALNPLTKSPLPEGTRMTLVDRNNQDKAYYATFSESRIKFSAFQDGDKSWTWRSSTLLCDLLNLTATSAANGKFAQCSGGNDPKATLRVKSGDGFQYYRPAETSDTETFNIQVGLGDREFAEETYFLTFQTNEPTSTGPYHFLIECNSKLTIPSLPEGKAGLSTVIRPYAGSNIYASNNENRVIINDFFTQTVTVSTGDSNSEMSSSEGSGNDTIRGTLTTTIKFPANDNDYAYNLFTTHIGTQKLKQQFCLFLKDQDGNPVDFVDGTTLTVGGETFTVEGSSAALWLPVQSVTGWGTESGHPAIVSVPFKLKYPTPESLMEQFPDKGEGSVGIQVCATSCLSMNKDALQRSNQRQTERDVANKLFYRTDVNLASMFYNAYDVDYPTQESGLSSLGINGWSTENPPVKSVALYNASALNKEDFHPKSLKCTVELLRKGENGEYITVVAPTDTADPLMEYLSSIEVIPKVYVGSGYQQLVPNDNKFIFELPVGVSWHENVQIDVNFAVRYGSGFEDLEKHHYYANYRVRLSAELLDDKNNRLSGTFAHDYIVYTNAKIRKELIS